MAYELKLDSAGIREILKSSEVRAAISGPARQVAGSAQAALSAHGAPGDVIVEQYTTDRAHALVVVRSPIGAGLQAKYGILTRAAAGAGLDVNAR